MLRRFSFRFFVGASSASALAVSILIAPPAHTASLQSATPTFASMKISTGGRHSCALTSTGGVKCWGLNNNGQLGNGTQVSSATPVDVVGLTSGVIDVQVGTAHSCALLSANGTVKCWGSAGAKQLAGAGTSSEPQLIDIGARALAVGADHACLLRTDNQVRCWGGNTYGQVGSGNTTNQGFLDVPIGLQSNVDSVYAGESTTCVILTTGAAKCWGRNDYGQVGDGTTVTPRLTPVDVTVIANVNELALGDQHTCALVDGAAKCWGYNLYGQLGNSSTTASLTPVDVSGLSTNVTAISAGFGNVCAIVDGAAKCWGRNNNGQLGDGTTTDRSSPTSVLRLTSGTTTIGAGQHNCATNSSGVARCWGRNDYGEIGSGTVGVAQSTPQLVTNSIGPPAQVITWSPDSLMYLPATTVTPEAATSDGDGTISYQLVNAGTTGCTIDSSTGAISYSAAGACVVRARASETGLYSTGARDVSITIAPARFNATTVSSGNSHSCAVTSTGGVRCWGRNNLGQLGNGSQTNNSMPVTVQGLSTAVSVSAGGWHTCALTALGSILCWGDNSYDQAAGSDIQTTPSTVLVGASQQVSTGDYHTCAVLNDGAARCWGRNNNGQLGDGTTDVHTGAVPVAGLGSGVSFISAGGDHTCAVLDTGIVNCWGLNDHGQLGDGSTTTRLSPVTVTGITNAVSVSVGDQHTCAVTSSGAAKCWGRNLYGQLGDGTTTSSSTPVSVSGLTSSVAAISARYGRTCATTTSGAVRCWGLNDFGQLGDSSTTNRLTPTSPTQPRAGASTIAAGHRHTCVQLSNGGARCWGFNEYGQLGNNSQTNTTSAVDVMSSEYRRVPLLEWQPTTSFTLPAATVNLAQATSDGDGAITYEVIDAGTTSCSVNPSTGALSFTSAGSCAVRVNSEQTVNFTARSIDVTFTIDDPPSSEQPVTPPSIPPFTPTDPELPGNPQTSKPSAATPLGFGITLVSQSDADKAKKKLVEKKPSSRPKKAPAVKLKLRRNVALVIPNLAANSTITVRITIKGKTIDLGSATTDGSGRASLPVFTLARRGSYLLSLVDSNTGRTTFLKMVIAPKAK